MEFVSKQGINHGNDINIIMGILPQVLQLHKNIKVCWLLLNFSKIKFKIFSVFNV